MPNVIEELTTGYALSEIAAVVLRTATRDYLIRTGSNATLKPRLSSGEDKELRKGDTIYAQHRTKDIVKGYDLDLTSVLMHPKVHALVDGGVATYQAGGGLEKYSAPVLGTPVTRQAMGVDIYCANKDTGGNTIDYLKYSLDGCEGKPAEFEIKDGEFYTPKYTFVSTPPFGASPLSIDQVALAALPVATPEGSHA